MGTRWGEGPGLKSESGMMPFKAITRRLLVLFLRAQRTAKVGESGRQNAGEAPGEASFVGT